MMLNQPATPARGRTVCPRPLCRTQTNPPPPALGRTACPRPLCRTQTSPLPPVRGRTVCPRLPCPASRRSPAPAASAALRAIPPPPSAAARPLPTFCSSITCPIRPARGQSQPVRHTAAGGNALLRTACRQPPPVPHRQLQPRNGRRRKPLHPRPVAGRDPRRAAADQYHAGPRRFCAGTRGVRDLKNGEAKRPAQDSAGRSLFLQLSRRRTTSSATTMPLTPACIRPRVMPAPSPAANRPLMAVSMWLSTSTLLE